MMSYKTVVINNAFFFGFNKLQKEFFFGANNTLDKSTSKKVTP